jgi:hypothetical protein
VRLAGSDRILLGAFAALAVGSIALKATAGPPNDGWSDQRRSEIAAQLRGTLVAQGFSTSVLPLKIESPIVFAERGACRLSVRDARGGKAMMSQFARDAATIGAVRYLYKAHSYDAPPGLTIRLGRLETEILDRIGLQKRAHIPVAVAMSRACEAGGDYGLSDVSLAA